MSKHFVAPEVTTPERRALFEVVEREVEDLLAWEGTSGLHAEVAAIALLSLHELDVVDEEPVTDWTTLRYDLVLERFPRVSLVHPDVAASYLDVWVAWAHWLHAQGCVDVDTRERLLDEIEGNADRFVQEVTDRFVWLAPILLGEDPDDVVRLKGPLLS